MSFYKEVLGRKTTLESVLKFDIAPTEGSTNPVTSDGVKGAIDGAVGDASAALQEQIDDIAEKAGSGYTPKGEATVATLNAISGQENGELYTMTDAGTLTEGSLAVVAGDTVAWDATNEVWYKAMDYAPRQYGTNEVHNLPTTITAFRAGDVIPVDGPSGTAKMNKDDLLLAAAQNTASSGLVATPSQVDEKIEDALVYEYVDDTQQTETNALVDEGSISGYKITYNVQYGIAALQSNAYLQAHCFAVEKGKVYRVKSCRGVDDGYNPYGVVTGSRLADISGTKTYEQIIYGGNNTGSLATKTFTFKAEVDGFVYLNSSQTSTTFALWECTATTYNDKIEEIDTSVGAIPTIQQDLSDEITRSETQDYFADKFVKGDALTEENVTADGSGSLANYKVYYNSQYNLVALQSQNNLTVHCYHVTAGKHYRIENCYGNNDEQSPYAVIANGQLATTSSTKTFKQFITDGITAVNPHKLEAIEFEAQFDGYLYVNTRTSYADFGVFAMNNLSVKEVVNGLMGGGSLNHWKGKKIVWMGTSVPYGSGATTSYLKIIQDALQFELVPAVIPGEALHAQYDNDSGLWYPLTYGSTCLSVSEYAAAKVAGLTNITIQDTPITPWVPGGDYTHYNNYYRAYDNVLTAENADADLWVLDVVPNNVNFALDDFNAFDFTNWKYSDDSSFASHRGTFLGALLFLINEIYTLNPQARILLFIGSAFSYSDGKSNFEKLTAKGVELLDIWADINRLKPSLAVVNQEGGSNLHPSTFGHECLGKRLIGRMLSVS